MATERQREIKRRRKRREKRIKAKVREARKSKKKRAWPIPPPSLARRRQARRALH